jgi:transcription elongation factor GreA
VLENSDVIKGSNFNGREFVQVGSKVTYSIIDKSGKLNQESSEIEITSEIDSDPFVGKVSHQSPLGSSLIGKKIGDIIEVVSSKILNNYKIKVLEIK